MRHAYLPEFLGACWCRQPADHHDHTGTWKNCPCDRCEFDRENASLFGWLVHQITERAFRDGIPHATEVPDTFQS